MVIKTAEGRYFSCTLHHSQRNAAELVRLGLIKFGWVRIAVWHKPHCILIEAFDY